MGNGMCSRKQKRIFQTLLLLTVVFGFLYGAMLYLELQTQLRKAEAVALKYQQHQDSLSAQLQVLQEPSIVTRSPADEQKRRKSLEKAEPEKLSCVPVPNKLEDEYQKHAVAPQDTVEPKVKAGTSMGRPSSKMDDSHLALICPPGRQPGNSPLPLVTESPGPSNSAASPLEQTKQSVKLVKVVSRKRRVVNKIKRSICCKCTVYPTEEEEPQLEAVSSVERTRMMEVSSVPTKRKTSPTSQQESPVTTVIRSDSGENSFGIQPFILETPIPK